ncbi:MAG: adenosine deaminase [Gemmatimonas sp.]|nr:adenosine deaminase [Gemmatimonas sp.]
MCRQSPPVADDAEILERVRELPKAELHVHLDGSLRPATLLELTREAGGIPPRDDPKDLRQYMKAPPAGDLIEYLERFEITLAAMQTGEALDRIAYELVEDLAGENVRYAEVRYSPILHTRLGQSARASLDAVLCGIQRGTREFGMRAKVILCALRHLSPDVSVEVARLAAAYRDRGVVGFDLAGPERGHPVEQHRSAFALAHEANLGVTIHAGEAEGVESIGHAIHICGAHRIGHGTRLFEDQELLEYVRDFRVPLEVCLLSNVQTGAVRDLGRHPLRQYFDSGLVLSLNTDNRLISGTTLSEEYRRAHSHLALTWADLSRIALMSFESAFLAWPEKEELLESVRMEIEELRGWT